MPEDANYYVATDGDDSNSGTETNPLRTIQEAVDRVSAGDLVYVRGGTYEQTNGNPISIDEVAGTESEPIRLEGYPGERPRLQWEGGSVSGWDKDGGFHIQRNSPYWEFRNLEVTESPFCGFWVDRDDGSHSIVFEDLNLHHNGNTGIQVSVGNCTFRNVISHNNHDPANDGENADGLVIAFSDGGLIENCVVHTNSDDGIDLWRSSNITIRNTISHSNGYDDAGDGNGFKLGGTESSGNQRIERCVAYNNANHNFRCYNPDPTQLLNCTSFNAGSHGFAAIHGGEHEIANCIEYQSSSDTSFHSGINDHDNSWNLDISDPGFASTDESSDTHLRLAESSAAIDAGIDVGLDFTGDAPDLGAYEYTTGSSEWGPATIYYHTGDGFVEVSIRSQ